MKTITWDKFMGLVQDSSVTTLVDGVTVDINFYPSKEMIQVIIEGGGKVYGYNVKREDNEVITVSECLWCVNVRDEQGMEETCHFQFLKPIDVQTMQPVDL